MTCQNTYSAYMCLALPAAVNLLVKFYNHHLMFYLSCSLACFFLKLLFPCISRPVLVHRCVFLIDIPRVSFVWVCTLTNECVPLLFLILVETVLSSGWILLVFFSALFVCCHVPFLPWLHPIWAVILFSSAHMGAWCFCSFCFFVLISVPCGGER